MEPLTAGLLAGGMVGSSLLGGLMGSQNSGDYSRKALRKSSQQSKYQSMIGSELMLPYIGTGQVAAQKLWGIGPTGQTIGIAPPGMSKTQMGVSGPVGSVPYLAPGDTISGTTVGYKNYGQTAPMYDRTGGAGQYIGQLTDLLKGASTPGVSTQKYIDQLEGYGQNFKFNADDPAYKYKTEEARKSIDKALASRGLFDSRPGVNMLADADRAIMADEYDKQYNRGYQTVADLFRMGSLQDEALLGRNVTDYNRQYGGLSDLFKMTSGLGETGYQSLLDAVKVGSGAASAAGQIGNQAAGNQASVYGQMAQQGNIDDANKASLWSGLGAMPMNAMLLYNLLNGGSKGGYSPGIGMTGYGPN